ncbi:MAG: class I adenylate-forming enzyme family protein [Woeseiaceae bacterium]
MNICDWIACWAEKSPDKAAILFEDQVISYRVFENRARELAAILQSDFDIEHGDRVAYFGLNTPEFLYLLFALARLGGVLAPLNWRLSASELNVLVENAAPKVLVLDKTLGCEWARNGFSDCSLLDLSQLESSGQKPAHTPATNAQKIENCGAEPLLLVYTSGTTGEPKGALLSHNAILANARNSQAMHQLTAEDNSLVSLPFFHVGGLNILTTPSLYVGGTVTLHRTFDPGKMLRTMAGGEPTRVPIVSAQMPPILSLPEWEKAEFPGIRSVTTGASPVSPSVYASWQNKGVDVLQVYGATETCPIAICTSVGDDAPNIETTGRAAANCRIRIVDNEGRNVSPGQKGEILIKGDNVMNGYWRNELATSEVLVDGWYASGDVGFEDDEGYYYIVDRKRDLIISGGENIFPAEVESLLTEDAGIVEAAVIGKSDERWGEVPIAVVRLAQGISLDERTVLSSLEGKLGSYKIPKAVVFVDEFPRNSVGKIQKYMLRDNLFRE